MYGWGCPRCIGSGALTSDACGVVETEDGDLVFRWIFVHQRPAASGNVGSVVRSAIMFIPCSVPRTLHRCIHFKISYKIRPAEDGDWGVRIENSELVCGSREKVSASNEIQVTLAVQIEDGHRTSTVRE